MRKSVVSSRGGRVTRDLLRTGFVSRPDARPDSSLVEETSLFTTGPCVSFSFLTRLPFAALDAEVDGFSPAVFSALAPWVATRRLDLRGCSGSVVASRCSAFRFAMVVRIYTVLRVGQSLSGVDRVHVRATALVLSELDVGRLAEAEVAARSADSSNRTRTTSRLLPVQFVQTAASHLAERCRARVRACARAGCMASYIKLSNPNPSQSQSRIWGQPA